mmetsp:Transcript_31790/g.68333  ORF Transcript_31790/g.68333 Transcript_31790/m.68333 type:complete len:534 (-) Transcript_31790:228-1829(-)
MHFVISTVLCANTICSDDRCTLKRKIHTLMSPPMPPLVYSAQTLSQAVEDREPKLLTGLKAWPASIDLATWSPAGLAALVPSLGPVRVGIAAKGGDGTHEFWNVDEGVAAADEANPDVFRLDRQANETSVDAMQMQHFWRPARGVHANAVHYYSGSLQDDDGRASLPDLQRGLDEVVAVLGGDRHNATSPPRKRFLKVWLGTAGATTPLHYDTQHNVYAQVYGEKEFWLWPPHSSRRRVRLYPRTHPLSHFQRGGSAGVDSPPEAATHTGGSQGWGCFEGSYNLREPPGECVMRVRLVAGDVLYLPPFWLHRATCRDACISTNVWVSSAPMHRMAEVEQMPLPFESHWSLPTRYAATLAFLRALLRGVHAAEAREGRAHAEQRASSPWPPPPGSSWPPPEPPLTPAEAVRLLLATRWYLPEEGLFRAPPAEGRSRAHEAAAAARCEPQGGEEAANVPKIDSYARRRADVLCFEGELRDARSTLPHLSWRGPKLILLHDQLELIAHWATGGDARATYALLQRLHSCCGPEHDEL